MGSGTSPKRSGVRGSDWKGKVETESPVMEEAQTNCGCRFPLLVALLQLLLGIAVTAVAFLMVGISSSLLARQTPHWAGIIMCVVSLMGYLFFCITRVPDERVLAQYVIKLLYFFLCTIGLIISLVVIAFQCYHYTQTNSLTCKEVDKDCVCTLNPLDPIARTFFYSSVSDCSAITNTLLMYYLLQILLNLAQAIVCLLGAFLMWKHRYQVFFAGLQAASPSTQQWQKI